MGYRDDNKYVIYPLYFDEMISRKNGRRVPKKFSKEKPTLDEIAKAAKSLNLNPIIENNVAHPSKHWKKDGRILINKEDSKQLLIYQLAKLL